ncbi:MAG: hypothetical protein RL556_636, partial [Actinomycetota bacterium]
MIEEIVIRDLGVIGEARLELGPGFNALTGETGAGKTMILTALGLLLGERADSSSVRRGAEQSLVEGRWHIDAVTDAFGYVRARLDEAGVELTDTELLINRTVASDGRSRASTAGRQVPMNVLSDIGENLVVVHGQSDQIRLRSAVAQREALDKFAGSGLQSLLTQYLDAFNAYTINAARLIELKSQSSQRIQEAEAMR